MTRRLKWVKATTSRRLFTRGGRAMGPVRSTVAAPVGHAELPKRYSEFLARKTEGSVQVGFSVEASEIHPALKPHQAAIVRWALVGGCRAIFAAFGLGKSLIQIEIQRIIVGRTGGRALIIAPLGVHQEFLRDAGIVDEQVCFVRRSAEVGGSGIYITNYESVRDGRLDLSLFESVSLDEASVLRSFGSKTFGAMLFGPIQRVKYRFVATATPTPNDYLELTSYAAFLGILDLGHSKTRWFKRNSEKAHDLTLLPGKEDEFWHWVSTWAVVLQRPSDLGPEYPDDGYVLPQMRVIWHEVPSRSRLSDKPLVNKLGQSRMFPDSSLGVSEAAREKRDTQDARLKRVRSIIEEAPEDHWLIWHDLESERHAIEKIPGVVSIYGSQDLEVRSRAVIDFSDGRIARLAAKPSIAGSGCNFQRHCHKAVFVGVGFKFNDFIQALYRIQRFLQTHVVEIHIVYSEGERVVKDTLLKKWERHDKLCAKLAEIVREYGLSGEALRAGLTRKMGVERREIAGKQYICVHSDSILETWSMERDSVGLVVTSVPFSTQYEYSPNYADLGYTESEEHFFQQMDYLTPELLRVLQPGRILAVHCKDRVRPGGMTGYGFQTIGAFHCECIAHYVRHGFAYLGMKTIVTDVVRENAQTYRLGWTEQCKDGSRMGCGLPEYLLIFRKPPTDASNGYADMPVVKSKALYGRGRWQIDAAGYVRSSGDGLLSSDDLYKLGWKTIYRLFRQSSFTQLYDYEEHVRLAEELDAKNCLPVTFALLQAQSWHPDVWSDITRMKSLNSRQAQRGRENHLCPLPIDIVDRAIRQYSNEGDVVYDPFMGIGTTVVRALKLGRRGYGCELNQEYFLDAAAYAQEMEIDGGTPSLFDVLGDLDVADEAPVDVPDAEECELMELAA